MGDPPKPPTPEPDGEAHVDADATPRLPGDFRQTLPGTPRARKARQSSVPPKEKA